MAIPNWIHLDETQGGTGSTVITITADKNTSATERSYTLTVTGGTDGNTASTEVVINQEAFDWENEYLTFLISRPGIISWDRRRGPNDSDILDIEYRRNGGEWITIPDVAKNTRQPYDIQVNSGDILEFKGVHNTYSHPTDFSSHNFSASTAEFEVCGNILSMIYGDEFREESEFNGWGAQFYYFFANCTGLTNADNLILLPSTAASDCYAFMFLGCSSLETAPELPATILNRACYQSMFEGCSSLVTAPELPAGTVVDWCYMDMFKNCSSLTTAPVLSAYTLAPSCYREMFLNCSSLTAITCTTWNILATKCIDNWVSGVAPYGIFTKADGMSDWTIDSASGIPIGWLVKSHNTMAEENLSFKVTSGGTLTFTHNRTLVSDVGNLTIQYRINFGSWNSLTTSTGGTTLNVSTGNIIEFRGDNARYGSLPLSYTTLSGSTAQFEAYGNMMSLIDSTNFATKTDITEQYCFNRFFAGSKITSARYMVLSTITLPMHCYTSMFQNCTLLTVAPELPNCVMDNSCCNEMYNGCSSLNYIRCYATDISAYRCTYNWVTGVAASGTFEKNTSTTWESGNSGIPAGWSTVNK